MEMSKVKLFAHVRALLSALASGMHFPTKRK